MGNDQIYQAATDGNKASGGEGDSAQSGRNPHSSAASHESAPQSAPNFAPIAGPSLNFPWPPLFATIDADATLITAKTRYGNQVVTMSATETAALGFGLQGICHDLAHHAGWWTRPDGSPITDNPYCFSNKLMLVVSELAEAMEGDRKGIKDDHLPHRDMREVELADAVIRIFDLAGAYNMDLGGAIAEKLYFNRRRADHTPEARAQAGGKAY